jgi:hypothetical protein
MQDRDYSKLAMSLVDAHLGRVIFMTSLSRTLELCRHSDIHNGQHTDGETITFSSDYHCY